MDSHNGDYTNAKTTDVETGKEQASNDATYIKVTRFPVENHMKTINGGFSYGKNTTSAHGNRFSKRDKEQILSNDGIEKANKLARFTAGHARRSRSKKAKGTLLEYQGSSSNERDKIVFSD